MNKSFGQQESGKGLLVTIICIMAVAVLFFTACKTPPDIWQGWKQREIERLNEGSKIAETAQGPVEYAIVGDGIPVLLLHGSMSGYDGGLVMGDIFHTDGLMLICISRPGYLRTPLETGRTMKEQADAIAALLDYLQINSIFIIGGSAGGPPAMRFAMQHPDRCRGLILVSSAFESRDLSEFTKSQQRYMMKSFEDPESYKQYQMVKKNPARAASLMFPVSAPELKEDPVKLDYAKQFMLTSFPMSIRKEGTLNDMRSENAVTPSELKQIRVPTLILHGSLDDWAPTTKAEEAAAAIPGAEMHIYEGDHMFFITSMEEVQKELFAFIEDFS